MYIRKSLPKKAEKGGTTMSKGLQKELAHRKEEEERLQFPRFSNKEALELGLKIVEKAEERGAAVAVDITVNGTQLFHYAMKGTNKRHAMWIQRKQNTVQVSQISSLHAGQFLESQGKDLWKDWRLSDADYAIIGGGFPIIVRGTGVIGAVACSGLPHEEDHKLLVDSISELLGIDMGKED